MANVHPLPSPAVSDYLGPAKVVTVRPTAVELALPDGRRLSATPALAFSYQLAIDDEVLVIGKDEGLWVIGVIASTGPAVLSHHGDIEVRAVGGTVRVTGDEACEIAAPRTTLHTQALGIVADRIRQTVGSLLTRARELWSVEAGEHQTRVAGKVYQQSRSASILTEDKIAINGKAIHLG